MYNQQVNQKIILKQKQSLNSFQIGPPNHSTLRSVQSGTVQGGGSKETEKADHIDEPTDDSSHHSEEDTDTVRVVAIKTKRKAEKAPSSQDLKESESSPPSKKKFFFKAWDY